jgi:hypothetical protein
LVTSSSGLGRRTGGGRHPTLGGNRTGPCPGGTGGRGWPPGAAQG